MKNVLITSAGRRVSLVNNFKEELRNLTNGQGRVFAADLRPEVSSACHVADEAVSVGRFRDPDYVDRLIEICQLNEINIVIPTIDTELALLAEHRLAFLKNGIHVIVSDGDLVKICSDKILTIDLFNNLGIPTPKLADPEDESQYPIFIKPIAGSGSQGLLIAMAKSALSPTHYDRSKFLHMECIDRSLFDEYTIDMYFDRNGNLKCTVPRLRIEVRAGEVSKSVTRKGSMIDYLNKHFGHLSGARGCITLQVFHNPSSEKVIGIEINPRFGGGYPLSYLSGANYPRWILREYGLGEDIAPFDDWEGDLLMLRYDAEVLVHDYRD